MHVLSCDVMGAHRRASDICELALSSAQANVAPYSTLAFQCVTDISPDNNNTHTLSSYGKSFQIMT